MVVLCDDNMFCVKADVLVCPVNTVGVMGAGLAKVFKAKFPGLENAYKRECKNKKFFVGTIFKYITCNEDIVCFPTKIHWRDPSHIEFIKNTLPCFKSYLYERARIRHIIGYKNDLCVNVPALGCGLGNLNFNDVFRFINESLNDVEYLHVNVFAPM